MTEPARKRSSILKLMAFVAAFGVVLGLTIEIGRASREASRRAKCMDNLKQIGLQIEVYHNRDGCYPMGTTADRWLKLNERRGWASEIYQFNEEGCSGCPTVRSLHPWNHPDVVINSWFQADEMYCPSCPKATRAKMLVPAAYIGIAGLGVDSPGLPRSDPRAGVFGDARTVRRSDIKDGLAHTMMVADSNVPSGPWFAGGRNTVRGLDPDQQPYIGEGRQFGGVHGGGANVLFADGSVQFVRGTVAPKVFEALSTIAGGEKVLAGDW